MENSIAQNEHVEKDVLPSSVMDLGNEYNSTLSKNQDKNKEILAATVISETQKQSFTSTASSSDHVDKSKQTESITNAVEEMKNIQSGQMIENTTITTLNNEQLEKLRENNADNVNKVFVMGTETTSQSTTDTETICESGSRRSSSISLESGLELGSNTDPTLNDMVCEGRAPKTSDESIVISNILWNTTKVYAHENEFSAKKITKESNSLGLLAQYNSGDDDGISTNSSDEEESVVQVPIANKTYREQIIEVYSDSDEVESVSSASSAEGSSNGKYLKNIRKEIDKRLKTSDTSGNDDNSDNEDGDRPQRIRQPPKVRGELLLVDLPPIEDLEITVPEEECIELGKVHSIVDQLVLVNTLPNSLLFDLDTVLFLEKGRKVLGLIFDVIGQVADPLYCVRFNSNEQIKERSIRVGDIVYCAPQSEHTQFIILSKITKVRGSDASWENDIEPPPRYLDYSDDEEEREARLHLRHKDRQRDEPETIDLTKPTCNETINATSKEPMRQKNRRLPRNNANRNAPNQSNSARVRASNSQQNYNHNYDSGSWHSNYYHNYHPTAQHYNAQLPPTGYNMLQHTTGAFPSPYIGYNPYYNMPPPYGYQPLNYQPAVNQPPPPPPSSSNA